MPDYKNKFGSPSYVEETIYTTAGVTIGKIRVKPSGVSWKPSGQQKYYAVTLDKFAEWITNPSTGATRTGS
jgi:hypothetical protein